MLQCWNADFCRLCIRRLQEEAGVSQARQAENGGSNAVAAAAAGAWQRRAADSNQ
jgi:hypothetical protein